MNRPGSAGAARSWKPATAWALFDWANSPYPTIVTTFIFAAYFTKAVAPTPEIGTTQWGWAMGLAGLLIAILAPFAGAAADRSGRRKPWLAGFSALCVGATALLWFTHPDPSDTAWALTLVVLSAVGFEMGMVFYNAMLPEVTTPARLGRLSGWAWGLGYAGGLVALIISLFVFVQAETPPFGLDKDLAEPVRATVLLAAGWFVLFAIPLFLFVPDHRRNEAPGRALRHAITDMKHLWRTLRCHPTVGRFLLARMIYTDGINTLFAFGGIYAAGTFGMSFEDIILLGIALNVTAGLGAAGFGWLDDAMGAKPTIIIGLIGITAIGIALLVIDEAWMFWALAVPMGLFFGPVQSASRSLMARLAPAEIRTEMFGLFALSGKITAFAGPIVLAWATDAFTSQRAGMATIIVFLIVGLILLLPLRVRQS